MSNMKATDKFFEQVEKNGLNRAFAKLSNIASDTLDCYLEDIVDDFVADREKPLAKIAYEEHSRFAPNNGEAYVVYIDYDRSGEWGMDVAYFIKDGELMSWKIVAKIRDLIKMGYHIIFE